MTYNGLGQHFDKLSDRRLEMTGYAEGQSVTTQYELNNGRVLAADAGDLTTYYLYGLGPVAELTDSWSYSLPDGSNTPRRLTDASGEVTLAVRYDPWGGTLETYGTGNFALGYFGGIMDTATGLLYIGNGQYYDPVTGRFLTRDAKPNQDNPYTPFDPMGALFAPLGVVALVYGRRRKGSKGAILLVILSFAVVTGMTLSGCGSGEEPTPGSTVSATFSFVPAGTDPVTGGDRLYATILDANGQQTGTPFVVILPTATPTKTPEQIITEACEDLASDITPTPTPTPTPTTTFPPVPGGTGKYSSYYYGSEFYRMLNETPGWWHSYQGQPFGMKTFIAIVYNYEFMGYPKADDNFKNIATEAFARRYWDAVKSLKHQILYKQSKIFTAKCAEPLQRISA